MNLEKIYDERSEEIKDNITHYLEWRIPEARDRGEDKKAILLSSDQDSGFTLKDLIKYLEIIGYTEIKLIKGKENIISLDITVKGK